MSTMGSVPSQSLTGDWLVEAIGGEPVDTTAPRAVRFEADTVAGRVGVNHFTGPFTMGESVIEVGELVSTLMAGPPELMALEDRFVAHLRGVHGFELEGEELVLGDGERSIRLIPAGTISVRGSVTYRERMLLPPGRLITVELVDMSDTAGEPIASDVITGASVPPVPFVLSIVLAESDQRLLGAQANIRSHRGTLLWATESPTALGSGDELLELLVRRGA